jgi:hypothetical protein
MTRLFSSNPNGFELSVYYLLSPSPGTHNIVATLMSGMQSMAAGSVSYFNVNQSQPTQAVLEGTGSSATTNIASGANNVVLDALATNALAILNPAAGQTERANLTGGNGGVACALGMSTKPGTATTTTQWSLGTSEPWKLGLINLSPP